MKKLRNRKTGILSKYYNSEVAILEFEPGNAVSKVYVLNQYRQITLSHLFPNEIRLKITVRTL